MVKAAQFQPLPTSAVAAALTSVTAVDVTTPATSDRGVAAATSVSASTQETAAAKQKKAAEVALNLSDDDLKFDSGDDLDIPLTKAETKKPGPPYVTPLFPGVDC